MRPYILLAALAVLSLAPVAVRADVDLSTDHSRSDEYTTERQVKVTQELVLGGMPVDTSVESNDRHQITRGEKDAEGNFLFVLAQKSSRTHIDFPGGMTIDIDTAADTAETNSPILQFIVDAAKATGKLKVTFAISPEGKVLRATADVPGLKTLSPESLAMVESQLSEESLRRDMQQEFDLLPGRVVKVGEFWNTTHVLNAGQGQLLTFARQCEYVGPVEHDGKTLHKINVKDTSIKFEIEAGSGIPLKLVDADLSIAESEGELLFDPAVGRIVSTKYRTRVTGEINFTLNGQDLPATLDLTMEANSNEAE